MLAFRVPACLRQSLFSPAGALGLFLAGLTFPACGADAAEWTRHTIDGSSRGADGIRLADVNADGRPDFVTGWEEGGRIRVCLHPGPAAVKTPWPSVTVGQVRSPEDAVFLDLDHDGNLDVVSCCEGSAQALYVHWGPSPARRMESAAWRTERVPASHRRQRWMFALPLPTEPAEPSGASSVLLFAGGKGQGAELGWWQLPERPRQLDAWTWRPVQPLGWLMSLLPEDVDGDGDLDVVYSDRKGPARGCYWLENPGVAHGADAAWRVHPIGGAGKEVMFMAAGDLDGDGLGDYVVAVRGDDLQWFRRRPGRPTWETQAIALPEHTGTGKGVGIGDIDLDGHADLVFTCENAQSAHGVMWLKQVPAAGDDVKAWLPREVSGVREGIKFDLVELIDLDSDGDLDVATCEERDNLGVIWYENPTR